MKPVSTYRVTARRLDAHGSEARCKDARLTLDTDPAGRDDAFNPLSDRKHWKLAQREMASLTKKL